MSNSPAQICRNIMRADRLRRIEAAIAALPPEEKDDAKITMTVREFKEIILTVIGTFTL